jgi:hypothetical protein
VLNAEGAVQVASLALSTSNPYVVYRPAAVRYTQSRNSDASYDQEGYFPFNLCLSYPVGQTMYSWDWTDGTTSAVWAGSTAIFKNKSLWSYQTIGTPYTLYADGTQARAAQNTDASASNTGWVDGWSWSLN